MADRGPVKIRQGRVDDLIALYKASYKKVVAEIEGATEAGQIQRARVMARINAELSRLGVDVDKWVKQEIPQYYLDGANAAVQDLRKLGIDTSRAAGSAVINRDAIQALTDDVSLSFAEGIRGVGRNAQRLLNDTLKRQLNFIYAEGRLTGETRKMISESVSKKLSEEGLAALVDAGGKSWTLETYSEMLVRTKGTEARNQGLANRMLQSGQDLVQVSDHNSDHPACEEWEGEILSLTGKTDGYATLDDATEAGLFHPNCEHAINVIELELAEKTEAYNPDTGQYEPSLAGAAD